MITSGMKRRHRNFSQLVCMRVCAKDKGSRDQPTKKERKDYYFFSFFFFFFLFVTHKKRLKNVLVKNS